MPALLRMVAIDVAERRMPRLSNSPRRDPGAQVQADFPKLDPEQSPIFDALQMARGLDPLIADVFKVSHHASKRGVYLELMELLDPTFCLISSVGGGGKYEFPHVVAQEALREAKEKLATKPTAVRSPDHELAIYYTADKSVQNNTERPLGTIATVIPPASNQPIQVWRFGDEATQDVNLNQARLLRAPA